MPGRKWGGVARRGAGKVNPDEQRRQPGRGRPPARRQTTRRKEAPELGPPPAWEPEEWIEEPEPKAVRREAAKAGARGSGAPRRRRTAPAEGAREISAALGPQ